MEYVNGEFFMRGCDESDPRALHSVEDLAAMIGRVGFLPLFSNAIPGFSVEEHVPASRWWSDDPVTDPWVWRQILACDEAIAYGKFFGRNAGFVSKEYFPMFANYRRNGYDFDALFDDGLASRRAKKLMDTFGLDDEAKGKEILSSELKQLAGFGKGGEKNYEGVLTDLQMQTYLITGDFRQRKNKKGVSYGWHIAVMETPETKWGYEFVASGYKEEPSSSWKRIVGQVRAFFPEAEEKAVSKMLGMKRLG